MDKRALLGLGFILILSANAAAPFLIKADTGRPAPPQEQVTTERKNLAEPLQVAKLFYESLQIGKYEQVYQLMHPQVQAEISQGEFIKNIREALNKDSATLTGYKLGAEKNYEIWRSPFDPQKRTYKNVREIEVVLTGKEKGKPFRLPGVLILAPMDDGTWRVLRL